MCRSEVKASGWLQWLQCPDSAVVTVPWLQCVITQKERSICRHQV